MNKLEVGMYVRTFYGISKIIKIISYKPINDIVLLDNNVGNIQYSNEGKGVTINDVYNSSYNIIDVIEKGDYVNGCLVLFAGAMSWDIEGNIIDKRVEINYNGYDRWLSKDFIKSIVTHEQFESMEYKVGNDNE